MSGILTRDDPSAFAPPPAFGPFRVLHQVGVGALGPVFRTYEPTRDRLVAVKVFRLDIPPEQAQLLADELAKAADAGLFHPSIVEPIAAGVEGTSAYQADEYVAAETLDVALRHYAPAPIERVLPFVTQLAGAIDFARTAGVGHGALHPRDIFVTPDEARAGGFGVVDALEHVGLRAPVRRPYTAPERIAGGKWDVTADVFSLAVIAYELLTGRRPSGTGSQIASLTGGEHAAAVHAVIVRAMSEEPGRRHPSALAFASELDAASRGEAPAGTVVAAAAAAIAPADVEEAAADIPPPVSVDERAEPVEAEQEEAAFRASEPEFDDIAAERDDDEAHTALDEPYEDDARLTAAGHRSLFEDEGDEAVEDLAIEPVSRYETERFADEFAVASDRLGADHEIDAQPVPVAPRRSLIPDEPAAIDADDEVERAAFSGPAPLSSYASEPVVIRDRRGFGIISLILAVLVGFAGGYSVRGRVPSATAPGPSASATPTAQDPAPAPAPQSYSEQAVAQPTAEPPQPAADAPPASRELAPANKPVASPPSTAPAPTVGSVDVQSTPSGAGVTLDGRWQGRTPLTIDNLRFGQHVVRVVQPGYVTAREDVALSSSRPSRELSFRLSRSAPAPATRPAARATPPPASRAEAYTGSIYVDSRPRGARVLVDGKFMGTTPIRVPDIRVGSHVVRLQLTDHADWTTSTRVASGQESRVTGSLERIR